MKKMLIIGIAGGSGSGKSTAAELIADEFGEEDAGRHRTYLE